MRKWEGDLGEAFAHKDMLGLALPNFFRYAP